MLVLDTNVVSELCKVRSGRADPGVGAGRPRSRQVSCSCRRSRSTSSSTGCCSPSVLIHPRSRARRWLDDSVVAAFDQRVLDVNATVARRAVALHVPDPAPFRDALIGATALVHGMTLVSRNIRDFARFDGFDIIDPWHPK